MKNSMKLNKNGQNPVESFIRGDIWVKLSAVFMGAGYFGHGQIMKGLLMMLFEAVSIGYMILVGIPYLSKFNTLGTVAFEKVFNLVTMKNEINDYDHSFKILLFGVITLVFILAFVVIYLMNLVHVYRLQKLKNAGAHINTFKEDLKSLVNEKFHITLLFLPCGGVLLLPDFYLSGAYGSLCHQLYAV